MLPIFYIDTKIVNIRRVEYYFFYFRKGNIHIMKKYIFLKNGDDEKNLNLYLFSDIIKMDNVECVRIERKKINNIFLKAIRKIHLSYKLAKFIKLPMKWIWYDLSNLNINKDDEYYIIAPVDFFWGGHICVIEKCKKLKNVKTVLIILDTIGVKLQQEL